MTDAPNTTVYHDNLDWLPFSLPETEGVFFKVLKADAALDQVILKAKFEHNGRATRHYHHCRAIAFTVSGEWEYDEGSFRAGDFAYEPVGNTHTACSGPGAEIFLILNGTNGLYLDNLLADGTTIRLGFEFFRAFEGLNREAASRVDPSTLLQIIAPSQQQATA